jgi:hypothetical protein
MRPHRDLPVLHWVRSVLSPRAVERVEGFREWVKVSVVLEVVYKVYITVYSRKNIALGAICAITYMYIYRERLGIAG